MGRSRGRRGGDEDFGEGRPVEPGEARAHGNEPDTVEARRANDAREERLRAEGLGPDVPASRPTTGAKEEAEEGSAQKEAGRSPGPAPMGGGDQKPTEAAGSKVKHVGDEKDPELGRDPVRRISSRGPAQSAGDAESAQDADAESAQDRGAEPGRSRVRRVSDLERE